MDKSEIQNSKSKIFLGVDGGQSHTEAVIADEFGNISGRGYGGASNHAEQPGGRERLRNAVIDSVSEALGNSENRQSPIVNCKFYSAHFGMTGGADFKEEIIGEIINAQHLSVGHDAPTALFGATAGKPGIVVIAGTGSVVYGENEAGETVRAGGLGFLFSDEGSGFWLAAQTIRLAIKEQDGLIENCGLEKLVTEYFKVSKIRDLTDAFYNEKVSRDEIASLAKVAADAALAGNETLRKQIFDGTDFLAESVRVIAKKLKFPEKFPVVGVGGMFRGELQKKLFKENLEQKIQNAEFIEPRFNPAIGALFAAYKQAGIEINETIEKNLKNSPDR